MAKRLPPRTKSGRFRKRKGGSVRRRNPSARRNARRSNPRRSSGGEILLVNPRRRRRSSSRRRRRNPGMRRRNAVYSAPRRRNPRTSFGGAAIATGLGMGGGLLAYGLHYGTDFLPIGPIGRAAAFGGAGALVTFALSFADPRLGAGVGGGSSFGLADRVRTIVALRAMSQPKTNGTEAGAVVRAPAGMVEGGAVIGQAPIARTEAAPRLVEPSLLREVGAAARKEAGASFYVPGRVEKYGPHSWVYGYDEAGRVIQAVSAHSV